MFIDASVNGHRDPFIGQQGAQKAIEYLGQVAQERGRLKAPALMMPNEGFPPVVKAMWEACRLTGSIDLTPMAAVAGSISDATADYLRELGATRVIVNNGGDVAIRLSEDTPITVGIRSNINSPTVDYKLTVDQSDGIGGVCTSGLGGRSLTRGIASAAVVFARRCSIADAAATEIANHACIDSPKIRKVKAETLDFDSDIKELDVTVGFDDLDQSEISHAIGNGMRRARELMLDGLVEGIFLKVCNQIRTRGEIMKRLEPIHS